MICFLQHSWPWRCFSPQHHLSLPGMKACLGLSHIPPNHPGTGDLKPLIQSHTGPHKTAPGVGKPNPTRFRLAMGARGRKCSHFTPTSLPKKHLGQLHWSPPHKHFSRTAVLRLYHMSESLETLLKQTADHPPWSFSSISLESKNCNFQQIPRYCCCWSSGHTFYSLVTQYFISTTWNPETKRMYQSFFFWD